MKLLCLVLALTMLLPAVPAQASTNELGTGYHASTTFSDDYAAGKAFDNDPATRWASCGTQDQWLCATFENEIVINAVEINEFWDRMKSFEIQYLDQDGVWQTCAGKVTDSPNAGIDTTHQLSFAPVKTTGMRLYVCDAFDWPSIYEFKMFYGGIQIVDGKSAVGYHASTTFGDEHVGKAFDNDPATRWAGCAEQNQWITAIFENEVVIDSVEIHEFWDRMNAFDIQYLDANGIWQTCASRVIETPDTGIDTTHQLSFAPVKTNGMRLYIHDAPGWPSIYEFKMFYSGIQIVDGKLPLGYHASTTFGDENVSKAFDNDPATRWAGCAEQNQWICAIFENEVVINSVEIKEFWDRMNAFDIQYLDENGIWQTCASRVIETPDTGIDTTHQLSFAPVKTTGMRLYIHDAPGWPSIYEFKMFYGGIQIVDGKSAVGYHASTTFGDEHVGKAFDNDPATRWAGCAEQNQWITAIFENEVVIDSVEIHEFWDRMNAFDIQYLDANGIWQTCASRVIETPDTGIDTTHQLSFAPVKTNGMRLYIHDAPGWPSIYEFKMFYSGIQIVDGKLPLGYHASTTFGDENVSKAFDNDPATRWAGCAEQNQWICAIFEDETVINSVEIMEFWDRMNAFEIQYLNENGIWQTCASRVIETPDTGIDTTHQLYFDPVTTTGVRLYIYDAPGWPSIYEFKLYSDRYAPVAQVGEQTYTTVAEAIANAGGGVVKMLVNSDEAITVTGDVTIDLAGNALSNVTVSSGKLQLIDTLGGGSAHVAGTVETFTEANGKTYLVVGENGVYSAHAYAVKITHISLDPTNDALGYKAELIGDDVVKSRVTAIGFNLWVQEDRVVTKTLVGKTQAVLRLKDILANNGGEMDIHATAFVTFGEVTKTSQQQTTTMKQTLQMVNAAWETYSETQQAAVKTLCDQYPVTKAWDLNNIHPEA